MTKTPKTTKTADKPWISAKGIRLLRKVKRKILAEPHTYRQDDWHCGTACCIAGHVALESGLAVGARKVRFLYRPVDRKGNISDRFWPDLAAEALGVSWLHLNNLFSGSPEDEWPWPFCDEWPKARTRKARAEIAARRIDHFITTGD